MSGLGLVRLLLTTVLATMVGRSAVAATPPPDTAHAVLVMLATPPEHYRPGNDYGGGYGDVPGQGALARVARRVARAHHLRLVSDWPMRAIGIDCFVMTIDDGRAPEQVAREISDDPGVSWAQPVQTYRTEGAAQTTSPLLAAEPAERLWHLSALHRIADGRGVTVAVIDSRIDARHPDLAGRIVLQQDFVGGKGGAAERHGTEVAGVIAGHPANGTGVVGVAPAARLMALRACWQTGEGGTAACDSFSLAKALHFAIERHAPIINMSLTGPPDLLLERLLHAAMANGATVVAAADRARGDGGFPASVHGVIGVVDAPAPRDGGFYGAPGRDIPTTGPGGGIMLADGSSFAAAHVSGLMALVRDRSTAAAVLPVRGTGGGIDACRTVACVPPRLALACAKGC